MSTATWYQMKKPAKSEEHLPFPKMSLEAFKRAGSVTDTDRQSEVPVSKHPVTTNSV